MQYFGYIVLSLAILLVMVLIHELGHYVAAKIFGFTVDEFSIGFGPKVFSKRRKNGELVSLRMLPLGGYCAFMGETDDGTDGAEVKPDTNANTVENAAAPQIQAQNAPQSKDEDLLSFVMRAKIDESEAEKRAEKPREKASEKPPVRLDKHGNPAIPFNKQKPWKRIIVLLGGVTFNLISAVIFSLIYIWAVGYAVPVVDTVYKNPNTGMEYCALQKGDVILAVDNKSIGVMNSFDELVSGVEAGKTVTLKVDRNGEIVSVDVERKTITHVDDEGNKTEYIGFGIASKTAYTGGNAANAFMYCVPYTFKLSWSILGSFGGIITGRIPITSMSGPVGSIKMMADVSAANWRNILILLPLLASNLAMFNILPFPALDGAQVIFTIIEWIRKKPINSKVQGMINFIGLIVLMLFVVIVDILSFAL